MRGPQTGILIMALAAVCFSCSDIGIKVLGGNLSPWQIAAGRGFFGMLVILIAIRFRVRGLIVKQWPCQMFLGTAGAFGFTFFIFSIKYLPLSIAMPLGYIYPAIGALISPFINQEKPGRDDWVAIGLAMTAVICLSQGASSQVGENFLPGLVFGLLGAFFVGLMINLARRQTQTVILSVNLFYLYFSNFLVGLIMSLVFDDQLVPPMPDLAKLFLFIAPMAIIGFSLMFVAYRYISAHRGGIVMTLEAAAATLYGLFILHEPVTLPVVLGGVLILLSGVVIIRSSIN